MTKYVLNSGGIKNHPDLKKKFHLELTNGIGNDLTFLLCNFAQAREYWESKFDQYSQAIQEDFAEKPTGFKTKYELAMPDTFEAQCGRADVIYFHGGDDHLLQYWMRNYNLSEIFKDKVVATNSASSNMLTASYWTCDWREVSNGFGIVPVKFIPHYMSNFGAKDPRGPIDWRQAYKELADYGDVALPIHALKEGEYIIVQQ
jgi:hypothetical protein